MCAWWDAQKPLKQKGPPHWSLRRASHTGLRLRRVPVRGEVMRGRPFPCDTKKPTVLPVHKPKLETEKNGHLRLCQLIHAWFSSWVLPGGWPGCAGPWGCPISRMGLSYSNGSPAKAAGKRHSQGARIGFVESMVIPLVLLIPGFKNQSSLVMMQMCLLCNVLERLCGWGVKARKIKMSFSMATVTSRTCRPSPMATDPLRTCRPSSMATDPSRTCRPIPSVGVFQSRGGCGDFYNGKV